MSNSLYLKEMVDGCVLVNKILSDSVSNKPNKREEDRIKQKPDEKLTNRLKYLGIPMGVFVNNNRKIKPSKPAQDGDTLPENIYMNLFNKIL